MPLGLTADGHDRIAPGVGRADFGARGGLGAAFLIIRQASGLPFVLDRLGRLLVFLVAAVVAGPVIVAAGDSLGIAATWNSGAALATAFVAHAASVAAFALPLVAFAADPPGTLRTAQARLEVMAIALGAAALGLLAFGWPFPIP